MADWEDMVNKVCVAGRPGAIGMLDERWGTLVSNARTVAESLREGIKDLRQSWKGQAAEDYFGKLEKIAKTIEDIEEKNRDVRPMLQAAKEVLQTAQDGMPVPDYMLDNVQDRADELNRANGIYGDAIQLEAAVGTFGVSYRAYQLMPGSFREGFMNTLGGIARETIGHITSKVEDWIHGYTREAEGYFNNVNETYAQTAMATAAPARPDLESQHAGFPGSQFPGGGPNAGVSGLGNDPFGSGAFDPSATSSDVGAFDPARPGTSSFDPDAEPLSSLAGAGGGLGDLGTGSGGLGGVGGGMGGLGAGAGIGGAGAGRPVAGPSLPMGLGGMPGMAGRGATARNRGMVGAGGPHGAGAHAPEDERGTWLTEDEDPWGGDSDAAPSILS